MFPFRKPNLRGQGFTLASGFSIWEAMGLGFALCLGLYFLALRILAGGLPGGDEGSWMSVAAELSRGNGYTTRWLEAHFLTPYTLPRPDDFRYPALTTLLAGVYRIFGISIEAARWTVAVLFLLFGAMTYFICRFALGRWTAMASIWLLVCSLLQQEWNSQVFTEGLFGFVLALILAWCIWGEKSMGKNHPLGFQSYPWWMILGLGIGILYFVRANGILFIPGLVWLYWRRKSCGLNWTHPILALVAFISIVSPWLIRSQIYFGNPLHIAGSAGMLRDIGQSHTQTLAEYFSRHDLLFPIERMGLGFWRFFKTLHEFEHGLEAIPIGLAFIAIAFRRPFFSPFITMGFALTFLASIYAAYSSWAGIRYMSGLLPFYYAHGLALLPHFYEKLGSKIRIPFLNGTGILGILGILLLILPTFYPLRFYNRDRSQKIEQFGSYRYRDSLPDHFEKLKMHLPQNAPYYAGSLCNVNFLTERFRCLGLQELYDSTWFSRSMAAFKPTLVVLTHAELKSKTMQQALAQMQSNGYRPDTLDINSLAIFFALRPL